MSKIIVVCGDAGGGLALIPVVNKLLERGEDVQVYAYRASRSLFRYHNINFAELDANMKIGAIMKLIKDSYPQAVITGTTWCDGISLEKLFILAAKSFGVPTLSVLDFWGNYKQRFGDEDGHMIYVPDKIAVMDEIAFCEACETGINVSHLVITGQPAHDDLNICRKSFLPSDRDAIRRRFDAENGYLVLFASQEISQLYGKTLGYDETTVLSSLIGALETISEEYDKTITLLIRPHPREDLAKYGDVSSDKINIEISKDWNYRYQAMASDVVVGMTSALLIEACYLGCIVVSVQPGLEGDDILATNKVGWSHPVYHESEIYYLLRTLLTDEDARKKALEPLSKINYNINATENVIDAINSLIGVW